MTLTIIAACIGVIGAIGLGFHVSNRELGTKKIIRNIMIYGTMLVISIILLVFVCSVSNHASFRYAESIEVPFNDVSIAIKDGESFNHIYGSDYMAKIAIYRTEARWYTIAREKYEIVSITRK